MWEVTLLDCTRRPMILRLTQKLGKKIGVTPKRSLPLDPNPFADWSGHVFTADRTQYLILTNTAALYSALLYGRGVTNDSGFLDRALGAIREVLIDDGLEFLHQRFVVPATGTVSFSTSLGRSVTGSVNDLVGQAKHWLIERELSPFDTSFRLNDVPMSSIGFSTPREAFKAMKIEE